MPIATEYSIIGPSKVHVLPLGVAGRTSQSLAKQQLSDKHFYLFKSLATPTTV